MIVSDQPTCFDRSLSVIVSSRSEGTILDRTADDPHGTEIIARRQAITRAIDLDYADTVYLKVSYANHLTYNRIVDVDETSITQYVPDVQADALFTTKKGVGLFLPVADCVATVVYDPVNHYLCLAHLGRHSTVANLASKVIAHFKANGSHAQNLQVWMAPHVAGSSYKLDYFEAASLPEWQDFARNTKSGVYVDLSGYNAQALKEAGVLPSNIAISTVDTASDDNYFSHVAGDHTGRFAVAVVMR